MVGGNTHHNLQGDFMKVKELIEKLKEFDDECEVFFNDDSYVAAPVGKVISTNELSIKNEGLSGIKPDSVLLDWSDEGL